MTRRKITYENLVAALNDYAEDRDHYDYHDQFDTKQDGYDQLYQEMHDPQYRLQIINQLKEDIEESKLTDNYMLKEAQEVLQMLQSYHNAEKQTLKSNLVSYKMPKQAGLNKMSRRM